MVKYLCLGSEYSLIICINMLLEHFKYRWLLVVIFFMPGLCRYVDILSFLN
jgi:hypothetical protein